MIDTRIIEWKNLDKLVFVVLYSNNRMLVQFPENSREYYKAKLLNNGNEVGQFEWKYLNKIIELGYMIVLIDSGTVYQPNINDQYGLLGNGLQSFEVVMLYVKNIDKVIFSQMLDDYAVDDDFLNSNNLSKAKKVNIHSFNDRVRKAKNDIFNADTDNLVIYDFNYNVSVSFFEIHKAMMGIEHLSNDNIIEMITGKSSNIKARNDVSIGMIPEYKYGVINTTLEGIDEMELGDEYPQSDEVFEKIDKRIKDVKLVTYDITERMQSNEWSKICNRIMRSILSKTSNGVVLYRMYTKAHLNEIMTTWYIVDDKYMNNKEFSLLINSMRKELLDVL